MIILPEDKAIISILSAEDAGHVLMALVSDDESPELSVQAKVVYTVIVERNKRISEKKSQAGKMGGAPKNNHNAKKQAEQADEEKTSETTHRTTTVPLPIPEPLPEDTPPYPPEGEKESDSAKKRKAEIKAIWQGYSFSEPLGNAVKSWGEYKREKRQEYKPQGLKSLLTEVQNNATKYGEEAVISLINASMAANYTGITWDKLARLPDVRGAPSAKSFSEIIAERMGTG